MHCKQCNSDYDVRVDNGKEMMSAEEMDIEIPYCPFCGEEDWRDGFEYELDI